MNNSVYRPLLIPTFPVVLGSSGMEDAAPPEVPVTPEVIPEDGCTARGGPGASSDQVPVKEATETSTAEPESEVEVDP